MHISYYDAVGYSLRYATNAGGPWTVAVLDSTGDAGRYSSIAADRDGKIHISYAGNTYGDLKYITNASGTWVATTVDTRIVHTSIAIAPDNTVRIAYRGASDYTLRYASNASGSWSTAIIPVTANLLDDPALAVGTDGHARVVYFDTNTSGNCALDYATDASGSWASATIEQAANPIGYTSVALDGNGKVHMSYLYTYRSRDPVLLDWGVWYGLKYATNASGTWVMSVIDSGSWQAAPTSIAIDSNNAVHISYYKMVRTPADRRLMYVTNASGSWVLSTIEDSTTSDVGYYSSIGVDPSNNVHIVYGTSTDAPLGYATNASGSWTASSIATATGTEVALTLDRAGVAHVAYHRSSSGGLYYVTNASGSWVSGLVDMYGGQYPSIAVDADGHLQISHVYTSGYPVAMGTLRYATNVSGTWALAAVDATGNVMNTSIALDSAKAAHIAYMYFAGVNSELKDATDVSGSWSTISVDDDASAGWYPSIAVDAYDLIHVGYFANGLRYARSVDTSPPRGSVAINSGASYTSSRTVTLTLSASDASGVAQTCVSEAVSCTNWVPYAASQSYVVSAGDGQKIIYVWFRDTLGNTTLVPYQASITLSTPPGFTDDPLQARATAIKGIHLAELRQAIDTLRARYSLSAVAWTDATAVPGVTTVKAAHLTELRTALAAVYTAAGQTPPSFTDPVISPSSTRVKAVHIAEIRAAILAIW